MSIQKFEIDITYRSILRVIGILVAVWLLYQILDILAIVFLAIIISAAITPEVDKLQKDGIPRILAALLFYLLILVLLGLLISIVLPPMISQISKLSLALPGLLRGYLGSLSLPQSFFDQLSQNIASSSTNLFGWLFNLVGGLGSVLFVMIISFYLTVEENGIRGFVERALPDGHYPYILDLVVRSQVVLAQWLKAQLLLMIIIGVMVFVAFIALGLPNALALATLAGIFEIIPFIGPVLGAIPAIIFALNESLVKALITAAIFTVLQQIESQILTPQIMKRTFEINPILVLIALVIGTQLGGIKGALTSVPLLALGLEFSKDYYTQSGKRKE